MVRVLTSVALGLGLAACASTSTQAKPPLMASTPAAAAPAQPQPAKRKDIDDSLVCAYERQTGSNIPEKVCRRRTSDEERQRTQDMIRQLQSHPDRKD